MNFTVHGVTSMLLYNVTMLIDASPLFRSLMAVEKKDFLSLDVLDQRHA